MDWMDRHCHSLPSDEASRAASVPRLGTSGDLEIQPVPDIRKRNITLDHFDCGVGRDQPCEWGIKWDLCGPTYLKEILI